MNENKIDISINKQKYNSDLILKILNNVLIENNSFDDKELYVDENWKISANTSKSIISEADSKLVKILRKLYPNKKISVTDNKDGSETIVIL